MLNVKVYRYDPELNVEEKYDNFQINIPTDEKWTVMQILDEIFQNFDPTIAYYKHSACYHGKCQRCTVRLDQKVVLSCQTFVPNDGEIQLDPVSKKKLVRDLVIHT